MNVGYRQLPHHLSTQKHFFFLDLPPDLLPPPLRFQHLKYNFSRQNLPQPRGFWIPAFVGMTNEIAALRSQ